MLQALIVPSLNPVPNDRTRCRREPWVKLSGTTWPRLLLQRVVADAAADAAPARCRPSRHWLRPGVVGPDAGEAVGLQLELHRKSAAARSVPLLRFLHLRQDAEQVLHVMADLVRDHVGPGEIPALPAAAAAACLHFLEERGSR